MKAVARFVSPTKLKLVFIAEWSVFSFLFLIQETNLEQWQFTNLLWPLVLYYLCGCNFVFFSQKNLQLRLGVRILSVVALSLAALDLAIKAWVCSRIPLGGSVPVVSRHFHLVHMENTTGSWVLSKLNSGPGYIAVLGSIIVICLLVAPLVYRFYVGNHGRRYWPALAYIGFVAGMASWAVDVLTRGAIIDYINMPGVVTADFKDILLSFGIASFFVEAIDNPAISARWKGWHSEYQEFCHLIASFVKFAFSELSGALRIR